MYQTDASFEKHVAESMLMTSMEITRHVCQHMVSSPLSAICLLGIFANSEQL